MTFEVGHAGSLPVEPDAVCFLALLIMPTVADFFLERAAGAPKDLNCLEWPPEVAAAVRRALVDAAVWG